MTAINPPQAVALRDIRTDDVVTIESGDDELGSTIQGRVHGVDTCKTAIMFGDQIWYSLADGSDWRYVTGYRRVPEVEPGTAGTATIELEDVVEHDIAGTWVNEGHRLAYATHQPVDGSNLFRPEVVRDFTPVDPDTAALRAEVERLNGLIAMADRMGAQITQERNDLHADVEAWQEWSNEVASMLPEEWDGDEAQQDIILRFVRAVVGEKTRADAAEARLAGACAAIAAQITSWQAENSERWAEVHTSVKVAIDAAQYAVVENLRDVLALVAADEQAAEGEGKYGSGDLPFGLTVSDDGGLINWRGDNYVRQGVALAALPTRDEIADAMHDDRLPDGEPRLGRAYRLILADAVLTLLKRGAS